ncbi:MAG TPA: Druantia anti-phage system protein DruA [Steroidobacteraceae bacterium]
METLLRYRGRAVSGADVHQIRELIAAHPEQSRRALSQTLCSAWDWRQANGAPREMVCRGLMLALWRAGHIELPAVRRRPPNPLSVRARPPPVTVDSAPLRMSLRELGPLTIVPVRRTPAEASFNSLLAAQHYLGYSQPVGEHLKFLVYAGSRPVALFAWSSAPRHLGPRDRFLGWSPAIRRANIGAIAYNTRYLILPWVQVEHLASHLLGRMTRMLSAQWQKSYGHPVYFAETFIDPTRYRGTCYRAANWQYLGQTQGRGKDDLTHQPNRTLKEVLGLPLCADYRERLLRAP